MDRNTIGLIIAAVAATAAVVSVPIAGLVWVDGNDADRYERLNQRFDAAAASNAAAFATINDRFSELRDDFRAVIPRAAAERKPSEQPPAR